MKGNVEIVLKRIASMNLSLIQNIQTSPIANDAQ